MRVSVLTIIGVENYGSLLQTIATQKKLEQYADDVQIINYLHNASLADLLKGIRNPLRIPFRIYRMFKYNKNFRKLNGKYIKLSKEAFTGEADFLSSQYDADIYFTGSDQIWNPACIQDIPFVLRFLSFIPDEKRRVAFSSSFGVERMDDERVAQSKEWIHRYQRISVREDSGVKILKEQYDYHNVVQLVDPTLALPPEFWRQCAPNAKKRPDYKRLDYILIYAVYINKSFDDYAKELSNRTGLPLVRICPDVHQALRCGKSILIPPVFDFISLIDNARYVLTDSLHATMFSMSLNTEPICVCWENPGRIMSFLRLIGEESRAVSGYDDFGVLELPVDFARVNKILAGERERVDEFLRGIFQDN